MKNLIDITDFSPTQIDSLINSALDIEKKPKKYAHFADGKILATLFFEPSTRTRLSFETAFLRLGGQVIGFSDAAASSTAKGESLTDTICTVANYADIIAMRHFLEGSATAAALVASCPIINAGDGGHCHPTQTLADVLTIKREIGRLDNLKIGICGDLLYGRAVHSLINAMTAYKNNTFALISPKELALDREYAKTALDDKNIPYRTFENISDCIDQLDVLYMTRIQRERFDDPDKYERLKFSFELKAADLKNAKPTMRVLHPLPRVTEINPDVDSDLRAAYFRQTKNGMLMRMALMKFLLEQTKEPKIADNGFSISSKKCSNPKCVSCFQQSLPKIEKTQNGRHVCAYCEKPLD